MLFINCSVCSVVRILRDPEIKSGSLLLPRIFLGSKEQWRLFGPMFGDLLGDGVTHLNEDDVSETGHWMTGIGGQRFPWDESGKESQRFTERHGWHWLARHFFCPLVQTMGRHQRETMQIQSGLDFNQIDGKEGVARCDSGPPTHLIRLISMPWEGVLHSMRSLHVNRAHGVSLPDATPLI